MANNTTNSILNEHIEPIDQSTIAHDSLGAILYIVIVLLWYSSSFLCLLGMQTRRTIESFEELVRPPKKLFMSIHDLSNNREVLEELADKQKRDKLWDIYLGTSVDRDEKMSRAETARIRYIEQQLSSMDNSRRYNKSQDVSTSDRTKKLIRDDWVSTTDIPSLNSRLRTRRRSSLNYKILEEWKALSDDLKTHEHWPWAIRKLIIRRHLRRQRQMSETYPNLGH